jgi:isorenieratene synthase
MNRRRLLAAGALALGASAAGLGGALQSVQPRRHLLPPPPGDEQRPVALTSPRRVVVVGGGLAGMVAATELAARGFEVTLVEQAAQLGGKLTGWKVRALGEDWPIEHGFHGFFSQYYNLRELLSAAGIGPDLVSSPGYPVLFADRPPEMFGRTTSWFPFNLLSVVRQSETMSLMDFRHDGEALHELMRYDGAATFARWDGLDFARFASEGHINRPLIENVLLPFGKTTLNRVDRLSAAEAIRFFHFYFMGNPEGLGFQYTRRDAMTAIVEPLAARLRALGGRVRTGLGARRLLREGARVTHVVVDAAAEAPAPLVVPEDSLPEGAWASLSSADGLPVLVHRRGAEIVALDARCTHMGCPVAPSGPDGLRCPCHGGRFDADGVPIQGPPTRPLARLAVHTDGRTVTISAGGRPAGEERLPCDHCVVACEVRGLQQLIGRSALGEPELERQVSSLGEAEPYLVWRLWLDRPVDAGRAPFYTTARFRYTDSLAVYSAFQEPFASWAARTGGSVVEVHAYAIAPELQRPLPELRQQMWEELSVMLPELAGARILHDELQYQSNFTRFAPGDDLRRPRTETPLHNLVLAGDHVKLDLPAALMEAAALSGRLAANTVLEREGLRQIPIPTVALRGPLA